MRTNKRFEAYWDDRGYYYLDGMGFVVGPWDTREAAQEDADKLNKLWSSRCKTGNCEE